MTWHIKCELNSTRFPKHQKYSQRLETPSSPPNINGIKPSFNYEQPLNHNHLLSTRLSSAMSQLMAWSTGKAFSPSTSKARFKPNCSKTCDDEQHKGVGKVVAYWWKKSLNYIKSYVSNILRCLGYVSHYRLPVRVFHYLICHNTPCQTIDTIPFFLHPYLQLNSNQWKNTDCFVCMIPNHN